MPAPSACGFPDSTNTGVAAGVPLTPVEGEVTLNVPGQVFENQSVHGSIVVTAQNVTIRNVKLTNTNQYYAISVKPEGDWDRTDANLVVDHVDIDLGGGYQVKGIAFNGYTARYVRFHNGADCAHMGNNVTIEHSLCVLGPDANGDGELDDRGFCSGTDHFDGFQSDGGHGITLRHNTIRNPCGQTSAILLSTNTAPIDNVVIDGNLMSGGGYTVYCGTSAGVATRTTYTNNVISREFFPRGGRWGPTTTCEDVAKSGGNIWDGQFVPPATGDPGVATPPPADGPSTGGNPAPVQLSATAEQARRVTRAALKRTFRRSYVRGAHRRALTCRRRSPSRFLCSVSWTRRISSGRVQRYRGTLTVERASSESWRYRLRVQVRRSDCRRCARVIKRTRTVRM
jgi:hypothetical protein